MKKAIAAFFENLPYASWPYIVGVENGDATLYIGGKLSGVTYGKIKYMPIELADSLRLESEYYNGNWCIVTKEQP